VIAKQHDHRSSQTSRRPLALVTEAASAKGRELARQLVDDGFDLLIAAEDPHVTPLAVELQGNGATVEALQVDLSTDEGVMDLYRRVHAIGRPLQLVALNAGTGADGAFVGETELADELQIIGVNIRSTVQLAKYLLVDMVARGEGQLLFTSSTPATISGGRHAVFNASTSFVQSFALSLENELKGTGVTVSASMPDAGEASMPAEAPLALA
jgi:short-subunit dehydrogenase